MKSLISLLLIFTLFHLSAKEYHVAKTGNDENPGTAALPLLTIQAAADIAQPGDVITVHAGIYREWVKPPRGGESNEKRIVYRAAPGEKVEIKGSEIIRNWEKHSGTVWKVTIPDSFFGNYNPFKDEIHGDWFNPLGRVHHTGEVYLNGKSLWEKETMEKVIDPIPAAESWDPEGSTYTWYCENNEAGTTIYANFHGFDPNAETVEINVRKACFYPEKNNINYITVQGFHMSDAATQWAPPTAEQIGLIGTNWSKGWIIENNVIRNSKCSGVTLGKHGDEFDNTSEDTAEGYVETIQRATARGWSRENIGSHIVRNNIISDCEQTGICGSMGGVFSIIENNDIFNIWTKRQFTGAEMGGIKIHASIDMIIRNNRLKNCGRGLWLDWMAQGTHIYGNLFSDNSTDDIFVEVNHGPFLIENNILLSPLSIRDWSEGGAFVHNLIAGNIELRPQSRETPFMKPHSTEVAGLKTTQCGDNRYYNNIFVGGVEETKTSKSGLGIYENAHFPVYTGGNVYLNGALKLPDEKNSLVLSNNPEIQIEEKPGGVYLSMMLNDVILNHETQTISTSLLGKAVISNQGYTNPDGSAITIDYDYLGKKRNQQHPTVGPFENPGTGSIEIRVWKK